MRTVYVNGQFLPENEAKVSVFDRGFLMADGVYEVVTIINGKVCDYDGHIARLARSLGELKFTLDVASIDWLGIIREVVARNNVTEGLVYFQVTRGAGDRDFLITNEFEPTIVMFTQQKSVLNAASATKGIKVITRPDLRWGRCDIKTTQLLYSSMMKTEAYAHGADDVWLERDGVITEGSSNNSYIVSPEGSIITRPVSHEILSGITRATLLELCKRDGIELIERPYTVEEAENAQSAFVTSASSFVCPVVSVNGHQMASNNTMDICAKLRELYIQNVLETAV